MRQWLSSVVEKIQKLAKGRQVCRKGRQAQLNLERLEEREVLSPITGNAPLTGGGIVFGPRTQISTVNVVSSSGQAISAPLQPPLLGLLLGSSPISLSEIDNLINLSQSQNNSQSNLASDATTSITDSINAQLPLSWKAANVNLSIPKTLTAANSELEVSGEINLGPGLLGAPEITQLDVIIPNVTGSLTVQIPEGQKIALGAASGAEISTIGGPFGTIIGGIVGGIVGSQLSDPTFSFSTDLDISIDLPDPRTLVQDYTAALQGSSNDILPNTSVKVTATNLQTQFQNVEAALISAANEIIHVIPTTVSMDQSEIPQSLFDDISQANPISVSTPQGTTTSVPSPVARLAASLQLADPSGTATFTPAISYANQTLNYIVSYDPTGGALSLTPQFNSMSNFVGYSLTVNPPANGSVQINQVQTSSGAGVEVTVNGQTAQYLPNKITSITINTGSGQNTVQILGVPAGVSVNMTAGSGSVNNVVVGDYGSLQGLLGSVQLNGPAGSINLSVTGSADSTSQAITIGQSGITGMAPVAINYQPNDLGYLHVFGSSGSDIYTITNTPSASGGTVLYSGSGANTVNVNATTGALYVTTLLVGSGGAADTVNVGQNNSVQGIKGMVMVSNGVGYTTLNVNDSADTVARAVTINQSGITGLAPAAIDYQQSELLALNVTGGTGNSTYTVANTPAGGYVTTTLYSGWGANTVNVLATSNPLNIIGDGWGDAVNIGSNGSVRSIQGKIAVSNPPSYTALNIDDSADLSSYPTVTITSTGITGLAGAPINYAPSDLRSLTVKGGKGGDLFVLNSTPSNPLVSTTVDAGAAGADFRIGSSMQGPLALVGNSSGYNALDYSTYTGNVQVNLLTGTATAVSNGVSGIQEVLGGQGNNLLVSNGPGEVLIGGSGRNLLIDGTPVSPLGSVGNLPSNSELVGGTGDNLIIGESLSYSTNQQALNALFAEWSRTDETAAQRMAHLRSGGGLNGSYVLNSSTLTSRGDHDSLVGAGLGFNWFLDDSTDVIYNRGVNSQVN